MAHDLFISYASQDKPIADAICATMERNGLRCWIAPRDILPGADWSASIIEAMNGSRVFVLVMSQFANASPQIKREVERAVNRGLPIIPYRIEDVQPAGALEFFLSTPHWLDAFTPPVERHAQYLADTVKTLLARSPPPKVGDEPPAPGPLPAPTPAPKPNVAYMAGGAGALVLVAAIAALLFWPPSFVGDWKSSEIDWTPGAAANFNPITLGELFGGAMGTDRVGSVLKVLPTDSFQTVTTFADDGIVSRSGQAYLFSSKSGPQSTVQAQALAPHDAGTAAIGGEGEEAGLMLQGANRLPDPGSASGTSWPAAVRWTASLAFGETAIGPLCPTARPGRAY